MKVRKVLVSAFIGLFGFAACGGSPEPVTVASDGGRVMATTSTVADTTSTTIAPAPVPTAPAMPPPSSTTTTEPTTTTTRPATTTTRPPTTTTTRPPARNVTLTAGPAGSYTTVTVRGTGCAGPEYGATLEIRDPSGQPFSGDGGLAQPDGTWELHESFGPHLAAGRYTFAASCVVTNGPVVFSYSPAVFTWTG